MQAIPLVKIKYIPSFSSRLVLPVVTIKCGKEWPPGWDRDDDNDADLVSCRNLKFHTSCAHVIH